MGPPQNCLALGSAAPTTDPGGGHQTEKPLQKPPAVFLGSAGTVGKSSFKTNSLGIAASGCHTKRTMWHFQGSQIYCGIKSLCHTASVKPLRCSTILCSCFRTFSSLQQAALALKDTLTGVGSSLPYEPLRCYMRNGLIHTSNSSLNMPVIER